MEKIISLYPLTGVAYKGSSLLRTPDERASTQPLSDFFPHR
jgi:hypothetical protein